MRSGWEATMRPSCRQRRWRQTGRRRIEAGDPARMDAVPAVSGEEEQGMMGIIRSVAVAILAGVLLAGCAATAKRPSTQQAPLGIPASAASVFRLFVRSDQGHDRSEGWETFRAEWRTAVAGAAAKAGRRCVYLDTMPETFEGEGILVVVNSNDYRYL